MSSAIDTTNNKRRPGDEEISGSKATKSTSGVAKAMPKVVKVEMDAPTTTASPISSAVPPAQQSSSSTLVPTGIVSTTPIPRGPNVKDRVNWRLINNRETLRKLLIAPPVMNAKKQAYVILLCWFVQTKRRN